ncbi:hypothetical protein GQR58_028704 [Nymphon striatum]|nr:hypothetical protein GQR58_028704 [Nymphon striatum]
MPKHLIKNESPKKCSLVAFSEFKMASKMAAILYVYHISASRHKRNPNKVLIGFHRRVSPATNGNQPCSPIPERPAVCPHRVPPAAQNLPHSGTRQAYPALCDSYIRGLCHTIQWIWGCCKYRIENSPIIIISTVYPRQRDEKGRDTIKKYQYLNVFITGVLLPFLLFFLFFMKREAPGTCLEHVPREISLAS